MADGVAVFLALIGLLANTGFTWVLFRRGDASARNLVVMEVVGRLFSSMRIEMLTHPVGGPLLFVFGAISSAMMLLASPPPRAHTTRLRARWAEAQQAAP